MFREDLLSCAESKGMKMLNKTWSAPKENSAQKDIFQAVSDDLNFFVVVVVVVFQIPLLKKNSFACFMHLLTLCKGQEEENCHLWYYPKAWQIWILLCSRSRGCKAQMGRRDHPWHRSGLANKADMLPRKPLLANQVHTFIIKWKTKNKS